MSNFALAEARSAELACLTRAKNKKRRVPITEKIQLNMINPTPIGSHSIHLPKWLVIFCLLFIPPVGWWHMWKNHRYHSWFPYILWLNSAIMLGFATYVALHFYPLLKTFFDTATYIFISHIGLMILALFEIAFGFYLINKFKNKAMLKTRVILSIIFLLFINAIVIPISQLVISSHVKNQSIKKPTATNQISMADWKTYTNLKYGYSLKYPPRYDTRAGAIGKPTNDEDHSVLVMLPSITNAPQTPIFYVNVYPIDPPLTDISHTYNADAFTENIDKYYSLPIGKTLNLSPGVPFTRLPDIKIDNQSARVYEGFFGGSSSNHLIDRRILIKEGENTILIGTWYRDDISSAITLYNQILSTFKFLNQNVDADASVIDNVTSTFPKNIIWQKPVDAKISYTDFSTPNSKPRLITGTSQTGTGTVATLTDASTENQQYLKENEWNVDNNLAADGPTGSVWGYKKMSNPDSTGAGGKTQILQLSYTNNSITQVPDQPLQITCPCNLTYKIFLSDPF